MLALPSTIWSTLPHQHLLGWTGRRRSQCGQGGEEAAPAQRSVGVARFGVAKAMDGGGGAGEMVERGRMCVGERGEEITKGNFR